MASVVVHAPAPVAQRAAPRHRRTAGGGAAGGRLRRPQRPRARRPRRPRAPRRPPARQGDDDREAHHRRRPERGDAVQRGRARPGRRRRAASSCCPPGTALPGDSARRRRSPLRATRSSRFGLTPNRPDALGHLGLAREAAALFERRLRPPAADAPAARSRDEDLAQLRLGRPSRTPSAARTTAPRCSLDAKVAPVAARRALAARVARRAAHLERRRRDQPRDARDRAPDARVRSRQGARPRASSSGARAKARSSRTLDGVERALDRGRSRHLRRRGSGGARRA